MYHPETLDLPGILDFRPYEVLSSNHMDTIAPECLMGYAQVEENHINCTASEVWHWNKRLDVTRWKVTSSGIKRKPAKSRRT